MAKITLQAVIQPCTSKRVQKYADMSIESQEIDQKLLKELIHLHKHNWKRVTAAYNKKLESKHSTSQLKAAFNTNKVQDTKFKQKFTEEEDQLIMDTLVNNDFDWNNVTTLIPGRSEIAIRNRFHYKISKKMRRNQIPDLIDESTESAVSSDDILGEFIPKLEKSEDSTSIDLAEETEEKFENMI